MACIARWHGYVALRRTREHGLMNNQRLGPSGSEMKFIPPPPSGGRPTCKWVQGITCVSWLGWGPCSV